MSPEQAAGEDVDCAQRSLVARRRRARDADGPAAVRGTNASRSCTPCCTTTPAPIRSLRPDVHRELEEIVARTMVRDRNARTITAADVRDLAASCHARLSSGVAPAARRSSTSQRVLDSVAVVLRSSSLAAQSRGGHSGTRRCAGRASRRCPRSFDLAGTDKFDDAFRLAQEARQYIPNDPLLAEQIRAVARTATIDSEPSGADVFLPSVRTPRRGRGGRSAGRPSRTPASRAASSTGRRN